MPIATKASPDLVRAARCLIAKDMAAHLKGEGADLRDAAGVAASLSGAGFGALSVTYLAIFAITLSSPFHAFSDRIQ